MADTEAACLLTLPVGDTRGTTAQPLSATGAEERIVRVLPSAARALHQMFPLMTEAEW